MLVFIIIIVVLIFLIPNILRMEKDSREKDRVANEERKSVQQKNQAEEKAEHYRQMLIKQYMSSSLTQEIIDAIRDGAGQKPEEIVVNQSSVSGRTNGVMRSYEFLVHRVPELTERKSFDYKHKFAADCDLYSTSWVYVYQQDALANAINKILGEEYSITKENDGMVVTMRLKPTKNF